MMRTLWLLMLVSACDTSSEAAADSDSDVADATLTIDASSFGCITEMTPVRGFYVDNLLGDVDATVAVANDLEDNRFPVGSVVQLVPQEAMVKRELGFSPETLDWEFFFLNASSDGTEIQTRGTTETTNVFGGNCFSCHAPAAKYDLVCEQDHGCDPLPIGPAQFESLQNSDPRCD